MTCAPNFLRGRVLAPDPEQRRLSFHRDALIEIDATGRIARVEAAPPECEIAETWPGAVILPGFVDSHLHFPQTRVIGSASGPLLEWLAASVFPEESRFHQRSYAREVAQEFCRAMIRQGTTCAAIYSSSHGGATDCLFEALDRSRAREQHLATHDPLTDLPNRTLFLDRLEPSIARACARARA